jgi:hypothetical protein
LPGAIGTNSGSAAGLANGMLNPDVMEEFRDRREQREGNEAEWAGGENETHMTDDRTKREYLKERGEEEGQEIS